MDKTERCKLSAIHTEEIIWQIPQEVLVLFIVGFADGVLIRKIKKEFTNPLFRVVIWEPDAHLFEHVCRENDVCDVTDADSVLIVAGSGTEAETCINEIIERELQVYNYKYTAVFVMPGFEDLYKEPYEKINSAVRKKQDYLHVNQNSTRLMGGQRCLNTLYALSVFDNNYTIDSFFASIPTRDIPVIIVAAGPSLSKNVDQLKTAYGKAIIIVLAHSFKTVNNSGCKIDLLAIKDGQLGQPFLNDDSEKDHLLITRVGGARDIQEKYNGRLVYYGYDQTIFPYGEEKSKYISEKESGSAAGDVFYMFMEAGFKTIILVGQDLAYDKEGYSHAGNEKDAVGEKYGLLKVEDIFGGEVYTRGDWQIMREFFETVIKEHPEITVIDATEGGAKIKGTGIMTLEDAIKTECIIDYPVHLWMENIIKHECTIDIKSKFTEFLDVAGRAEETIEKVLRQNIKIYSSIRDGLFMGNIEEIGRYDSDFTKLLKVDDTDLIWLYAEDVVNSYLSQCIEIEKQGSIEQKIIFENRFLKNLLSKVSELKNQLLVYVS